MMNLHHICPTDPLKQGSLQIDWQQDQKSKIGGRGITRQPIKRSMMKEDGEINVQTRTGAGGLRPPTTEIKMIIILR